MTRRMLRAFKTDVAAISHHCEGIARPKISAEGGDGSVRGAKAGGEGFFNIAGTKQRTLTPPSPLPRERRP
jgi:hypothetical protein